MYKIHTDWNNLLVSWRQAGSRFSCYRASKISVWYLHLWYQHFHINYVDILCNRTGSLTSVYLGELVSCSLERQRGVFYLKILPLWFVDHTWTNAVHLLLSLYAVIILIYHNWQPADHLHRTENVLTCQIFWKICPYFDHFKACNVMCWESFSSTETNTNQ